VILTKRTTAFSERQTPDLLFACLRSSLHTFMTKFLHKKYYPINLNNNNKIFFLWSKKSLKNIKEQVRLQEMH
jgi:hypothetical protein